MMDEWIQNFPCLLCEEFGIIFEGLSVNVLGLVKNPEIWNFHDISDQSED